MDWLTLSAAEIAALTLSMRVALWCVAVTAGPAILIGWLLARREFRGKTILDAVVHLPLVLPPVVVGYILLLALGRHGAVGALLSETLGFEIAFTWMAAVVASAVMGFPLMVRAIRLSIELVEPRFEEAARTLGAGPRRVWATVTLPLALPGILTGTVLAFTRSRGEVGATITFAGNIADETRTLPLALFTYVQIPGGEAPAMRLVVISVLLSLTALVVSEILARRIRNWMGSA